MSLTWSVTNHQSMFFLVILITSMCFIAYAKVIPVQKQEIFQMPLDDPGPYTEYFEKVFAAIQKMLVFYNRQYKKQIIDSVYGLRVLEGVVEVILREHRRGIIQLSSNYKKSVAKLGVEASRIAVKTYPYLKAFSENYFSVMGFTVMEPWRNIKPLKKLSDDKYGYKPQNNYIEEEMKEDKQDKCFNALVGDKKTGLDSCTVSDECWKANTKPGQKSYFLTHQLLYFLLGQTKGCSEVFEARFKAEQYRGGMDRFVSDSCHAMLPEMNKQEKIAIKKKTLGEIDLFLEQAVVCGMVGYSDFFSLERLDRILSWRHKDGCFGFTDEIGGREDLGNEHGDSDVPVIEQRKTMRKLTVTRDLKGGCEVHSTGVGIGLFALYLRWLFHVSSNSHLQSHADKSHKHDVNSSNLMSMMFLFISLSIVILFLFSNRMRVCFHRNKLVRTLCPCI